MLSPDTAPKKAIRGNGTLSSVAGAGHASVAQRGPGSQQSGSRHAKLVAVYGHTIAVLFTYMQ
jgi:hypothetical protein